MVGFPFVLETPCKIENEDEEDGGKALSFEL